MIIALCVVGFNCNAYVVRGAPYETVEACTTEATRLVQEFAVLAKEDEWPDSAIQVQCAKVEVYAV
jgi:hypothetical protein